MRDRVSEGGGAVEREMKNQRLVTSWKDNVLAEWGGDGVWASWKMKLYHRDGLGRLFGPDAISQIM